MSSYAPLFANPHWQKWQPVAAIFDNTRAYATPSYHVQAMFASNRPDAVVPVTLPQPANAAPMLFASAGLKRDSGDAILKVVNRGAEPVSARIELAGRTADYSRVTSTELAASALGEENTFEQPRRIAPRTSSPSGLNEGGRHVFRPYSVTILRWSQGR